MALKSKGIRWIREALNLKGEKIEAKLINVPISTINKSYLRIIQKVSLLSHSSEIFPSFYLVREDTVTS